MRLLRFLVFLASVVVEPTVVLAAGTTSTTTTATTASATPAGVTSLPGLITELPPCALQCLTDASSQFGCAATDLSCICTNTTSNRASLEAQVGSCILFSSSCQSSDLNLVQSLAPQICAALSAAPSSVLSAATQAIWTELAAADKATGTGANGAAETTAAASPSGNAAVPLAGFRATMALLGIGGVAVLAVLLCQVGTIYLAGANPSKQSRPVAVHLVYGQDVAVLEFPRSGSPFGPRFFPKGICGRATSAV
ncbi:Extracellular membrane protein, CFEM domain protein [Niveomyces insectorum RCEF 264]|uniref:Extracellular membrane protein, CFEM domain protein n=1 Tax=Niveomyces insectorum RCEF 264 TaxID=1081102 RepID=A0A162KAK0_9HYPO|nr:Extracellular membrane protein, CFEM domain protein [Niveomyces insectorum RCEF 264]